VTNIAHQLGFYETIARVSVYTSLGARIAAVTTDDVARVARRYLRPANRTIGWFRPLPPASPGGPEGRTGGPTRPISEVA
jgi:predicted Zn-dependent peptidase